MIAQTALGQSEYGSRPGAFRILVPTQVYVDAYQVDEFHDSYLDPVDSELQYGANFVTNFDVIRYGAYGLWSHNKIHFDQSGDTGHIRHGGWEFEVGLTVIANGPRPLLSIIRLHHSRHLMEGSREFHFPVYDMTGIRLHIIDF